MAPAATTSASTSRWRCSPSPQIAVCHFGLFRDLTHTLPSLRANVHAALERQLGGVDVFVHALLVSRLVNSRSGEDATLDPQLFFGLAPACRYAAEDQDEVDQRLATRRTKTGKHKPAFSGAKLSATERGFDLASTRNALRAKYSLQKTADMVRAHEAQGRFRYRFVAAVRPDTAIFTPVVLPDLLLRTNDTILVPNCHHWGGVNDRFAVGTRHAMLDVYMQWAQTMLSAGVGKAQKGSQRNGKRDANTEGQLCAMLRGSGIQLLPHPLCVVRIRSNGDCNQLDLNPTMDRWENQITCTPNVLATFETGAPGPCAAVSADPPSWARHCYPGGRRLGAVGHVHSAARPNFVAHPNGHGRNFCPSCNPHVFLKDIWRRATARVGPAGYTKAGEPRSPLWTVRMASKILPSFDAELKPGKGLTAAEVMRLPASASIRLIASVKDQTKCTRKEIWNCYDVSATCDFLGHTADALRRAPQLTEYTLFSIGMAGEGSPFYWVTLRLIEERCGAGSTAKLLEVLEDPKLRAWYVTQDFPLEPPGPPPADRNAEPFDPRSGRLLYRDGKGHAANWVAEAHPKLQYLPLGVDVEYWNRHTAFSALVKTTLEEPKAQQRPRLLYVNFGMWHGPSFGRSAAFDQIRANFARHGRSRNGSKGRLLFNSYMAGSGLEGRQNIGRCYTAQSACQWDGMYHNYTAGLLQSKFVLAPRGIGVDSFRVWEALSAGCIPVVDDTYLHRRLLDKLPAVFAADWSVVTPQFLRAQYVEIHRRAGSFEMSRLLAQRVRGEVSVRHRKG